MIAASVLLVAALVADVDFSDREAGVLRDRAHPGAAPGRAPTANAYGRLPGAGAVAAYATGRDGRTSAVVTGAARKGAASPALLLPGAASLPAKGPSTQVFWFNVLGRPAEKSGALLLDCARGWRAGYRLEWACYGSGDAWHGIVTLTLGVGPGERHTSLSTERQVAGGVPGDVWHQVALVQDAQAVRFYLDGAFVDAVAGAFRTEGRALPVVVGTGANGVRFKTDAFRVYDEAWTAERVAADWQAGKDAAKDVAAAGRPRLVGAEDGVCETGRVVRIVRGGREVATRAFARPGVTNFVYGGYVFPLCVVPRLPKTVGGRGVGAVELMTEQSALLRLGVRTSLVRASLRALEPEPGVYDWRALDRRVEACRAEGVEPVLAMADGEPSERLARLLAARYGAAFVREKDVAFVSLAGDPRTLGRRLDAARATGRRVFLTPQAHVWRGVWADAYRGYPTDALLALAAWLDRP